MRRDLLLVTQLCWPAIAGCAAPLPADSRGELVKAAILNDAGTVRSLLEGGADPDGRGPDGSTALHWAAHWNDLEMAEALVVAGAKAGAANRFHVTPLMLAAANGGAAMIEALVGAGADPNDRLPAGETVLMTAARTGMPEAIQVLLEHGADVNATETWKGQTGLMWASGEGHREAVRLLLEAGADVRAKSNRSYSALVFAVRQGHLAVTRALVEAGADVNDHLPRRRRGGWGNQEEGLSPPGASVLHLAVANAHYELAALLLDLGADPNASGPGWTTLHEVSWVRKAGVGSNDPAPEGSGSLSSLEFVRKLVAAGADVNARMTSGTSPGLHSLNTMGATPFVAAARTADADLMRLLHSLGADPTIPTEAGTTPLMVAAGVGVRAPDEDAGTPKEVVEAVKVALEFGGDPNSVDGNGNTAMHGAAYKHVPGAVRLLHEAGADVRVWNRKNDLGWTPLRIATGVHRGMNFRFSPETAAAIRELLKEAGLSTEVEPEEFISGATK